MNRSTAKPTVNGRTLIATLIEEAPSEAAIVRADVRLSQAGSEQEYCRYDILLRPRNSSLLMRSSTLNLSEHREHRSCLDHGLAVGTLLLC